MVQIIDEKLGINMTSKFSINQEVVVASYQGYRKGVVTGISASLKDKGGRFLYTVELYVGKKSTPKIKKCLEKYLYGTVKEAINHLLEEDSENNSINDTKND